MLKLQRKNQEIAASLHTFINAWCSSQLRNRTNGIQTKSATAEIVHCGTISAHIQAYAVSFLSGFQTPVC